MFFLIIFSIYTKRINVRYCWLGKKTKLMWQICFKKKISWEILIFWVEVGKDVEVLLVNCFQSPTLKIHDKIVSLVHQIIDFIPDFICCCTNLTCVSLWKPQQIEQILGTCSLKSCKCKYACCYSHEPSKPFFCQSKPFFCQSG